jgi:hypothetical protein
MIFRLYKPEVFQGNLKKKNYFEGWYFKHVSSDMNNVLIFIPGISLNNNDPHAFIQIIDGITGVSDYLTYPLQLFSWHRDDLFIRIGNSVFTDKYVNLDIDRGKFRITGQIDYHGITEYPKTMFSPGIMGWYSFVPTMECKHGIISANHILSGSITLNNNLIDFNTGKGYIEKDWGTSFPESWLWIQANNFGDRGSSLSFSVAKIPWRGRYFIGFISFLYYKKKFYIFCTYNNSIIKEIKSLDDSVSLVLTNRKNTLRISATRSAAGILKAPSSGEMTRRIKESNDSNVSVALYNSKDEIIFTDTSPRAGIEVIEKIFDYFKN